MEPKSLLSMIFRYPFVGFLISELFLSQWCMLLVEEPLQRTFQVSHHFQSLQLYYLGWVFPWSEFFVNCVNYCPFWVLVCMWDFFNWFCLPWMGTLKLTWWLWLIASLMLLVHWFFYILPFMFVDCEYHVCGNDFSKKMGLRSDFKYEPSLKKMVISYVSHLLLYVWVCWQMWLVLLLSSFCFWTDPIMQI